MNTRTTVDVTGPNPSVVSVTSSSNSVLGEPARSASVPHPLPSAGGATNTFVKLNHADAVET